MPETTWVGRSFDAADEQNGPVHRRLIAPRLAAGATVALTASVVALAAGRWGATGVSALAATAVAVAGAIAATCDVRTRRIPNRLVLLAGGAVALAAAGAGLLERDLGGVAGAVALGVVCSGAPLLVVTWLVAPAAIGGGDWKLLAVLGAAVGLVEPLAAPVIVVVACVVAIAVAAACRRRVVAFAPPLLVGYLAALLVAVVWRGAVTTTVDLGVG